MPNEAYAGDVSSTDAWNILRDDPDAVLIDVRTDAEFSYVGVPDLSSLCKEPLFISWKLFPTMKINGAFAEHLLQHELDRGTQLLFICRSGVRSKSAAQEMTANGFTRCINISEGFEGDADRTKHRGTIDGWKVAGLPWVQG